MGVRVGVNIAPGALPPVVLRIFGLAEQARMNARLCSLLECSLLAWGPNSYRQGRGPREHPWAEIPGGWHKALPV